MNSILVISPYKAHGMWVFDDPRLGLTQEPFAGGANTLIDRMVEDIPNADTCFRIVFSAQPFPGGVHRFIWVRPEMSGNIYRSDEYDAEGWLCPALLKYSEFAPPELYVQVALLEKEARPTH